ncbi:MAG TPA: serine/threonine-protein kinase, partial [Polyangiaceae bacterium]|nr:serine/threonine-protein kinase [Polyangiaceae bacterium]
MVQQAELLPQPGQLVGGKYRMVRVLGRGAMGAVYEAHHAATGKRVAIKWLHPHVMQSRSAVERLVREAQAAARVRHSNVVDVYDVEREGSALFLVMEYLEGEPLSALITRGGVPLHELVGLLLQAMRGVGEAHRQGIVHRDIKPDNIFLAYEPDQPRPVAKVLDFGISKLEAPNDALSLTQTGSTLGTPLYMSYEQLSGVRDIDGRTDIYSFGVILYEVLTGRLPFEADNFADLAAKVITSEPVPPRQLRPDLPE